MATDDEHTAKAKAPETTMAFASTGRAWSLPQTLLASLLQLNPIQQITRICRCKIQKFKIYEPICSQYILLRGLSLRNPHCDIPPLLP
jgi:hypothetical protein